MAGDVSIAAESATPFKRDAAPALALGGAFGVAAALAVPPLVGALPREASDLPLPLPLFCLFLAVQMTVLYGLLALAGLRLARRQGLEPLWAQTAARQRTIPIAAAALGLGMLRGVWLIGAVAAIQRLAPGTLPEALHPPTWAAALAASTAASIGEEILFRLFLLTLLLRLLPRQRWAVAAAVGISALAFGAAHTPGLVYLYGGFGGVPRLTWVWLLALNGALGVVYALTYLRAGLIAAMLAHFGTDLIWHVASRALA